MPRVAPNRDRDVRVVVARLVSVIEKGTHDYRDGGETERRSLSLTSEASSPVASSCPRYPGSHLIYNAGLTSPAESGLCSEAIRPGRILSTLMPDEPG
jgi:hypothetical protein